MTAPDLFAEPKPERPVLPDLRLLYIVETYNLPVDWQWHAMRACEGGWIMEGGVYPVTHAKGKNKGRPDYKKPVAGTEKSCIGTAAGEALWRLGWEARTGKCWKCQGAGEEQWGWSRDEGRLFRPCKRCKASGVAPAMPASAPEPGQGASGTVEGGR